MAKLTYAEIYRNLDGLIALQVATTTPLRKNKDEKDTAFVKRIVATYCAAAQNDPEARQISNRHEQATPMTIGTYRDEFPVGTRVVVRANKSDGSDYEFNRRAGTIVEFGKCLAVELDKPPRYGENPVLISMHTLRHENDSRHDRGTRIR